MNLKILKLTGSIYDGYADSINLKSESGELTILNDHKPLITTIIKGIIHIKTEKSEKNINLENGFLIIRPKSEVTILTN